MAEPVEGAKSSKDANMTTHSWRWISESIGRHNGPAAAAAFSSTNRRQIDGWLRDGDVRPQQHRSQDKDN